MIKAKNPPTKKKGAKGIYFCFLRHAHNIPNRHAPTKAIDNPNAPNQIPPTAINFMSPIPIGAISEFALPHFSNIIPITEANRYPNTAPTTDSFILHTHGVKFTTTKPNSKSGNKYASGMILRLKSARAIL